MRKKKMRGLLSMGVTIVILFLMLGIPLIGVAQQAKVEEGYKQMRNTQRVAIDFVDNGMEKTQMPIEKWKTKLEETKQLKQKETIVVALPKEAHVLIPSTINGKSVIKYI